MSATIDSYPPFDVPDVEAIEAIRVLAFAKGARWLIGWLGEFMLDHGEKPAEVAAIMRWIEDRSGVALL